MIRAREEAEEERRLAAENALRERQKQQVCDGWKKLDIDIWFRGKTPRISAICVTKPPNPRIEFVLYFFIEFLCK